MVTGSRYQSWHALGLKELLFHPVLFEGLHGNIRDTWVEGITEETPIYITSSPAEWSNDDIGLGWLSQAFDRFTKEKVGRCWRLLLDGHGSHFTWDFWAFCDRNRILLMIYPPMPPTVFRHWMW
jgi:hypothetical protein